MSRLFHNIFTSLFLFGTWALTPWNVKARLWIKGRKNILERIRTAVAQLPYKSNNTIWMHCASLGEFEQGRPLIERIRSEYPTAVIIVTFFSPSGYEIRKDYKGADLIFYLPMDTAANARKFVDIIQPTLVLWIRYEFWLYYLRELKQRKIPVLLVSGVFRSSNVFFKPWGRFWRNMLHYFTHLFVQNESSQAMLRTIGFTKNITVSGDTRFDRVSAIADNFHPIPEMELFCKGHRVLVAGSTWNEDEEELTHYVKANKKTRFVIAPHEIDAENIKDVQKLFPGNILFSELKDGSKKLADHPEINTLIIDNIGMLSRLYYYADITYIGGGFGDNGLHNILEAAVYGKPVLFGPNYEKHFEAVEMEEAGGAISIENALELEAILDRLWRTPHEMSKRGEAAKFYVMHHKGATNIVMDYVYKNRLLTS